jgi:hypothetical protein
MSLSVRDNIDVLKGRFRTAQRKAKQDEQTRFLANPNLISDRVNGVTLGHRAHCEVIITPIRQSVTLI